MKHILFVIDSLHCGGAEKSLVTLLNNLDYSKYNIDIHIVKRGGEFEKFLPQEVNVLNENIFSGFNRFTILFSRVKYWLFRKADRKKKYHPSQHFWTAFNSRIKNNIVNYDVAIAYGQGFSTYYVAKKTNASFKYAWLNTDHQKSGYDPAYDYQIYSNYSKVIAVSNESRLSLQKAMKAINRGLSIEIIKDISDKEFIQKMSTIDDGFDNLKNNSEKILLTVCRLEKVKGLDLAINACEMLVKKGYNIKWYVIGEGSERSNLERWICDKNLQDHFILLGFKENPYPFMKKCDIYVQTSLFEGLGLTVIEAAILQKPIVTTNFSTAATIVSHEETGLICEMDAEHIATCVAKYIQDSSFTYKITQNLSRAKNNDKEKSLESFYKLIN